MAFQPAAMALDGGDPRMNPVGSGTGGEGINTYAARQMHNLHDPSVGFEEYYFYAQISRAAEAKDTPQSYSILPEKFRKRGDAPGPTPVQDSSIKGGDAKEVIPGRAESTGSRSPPRYGVSDEEWLTASRAARTATWGAVFYLITTDILGPYSVPWALSQIGYGPGIALYFIFVCCAAYGGWQLWRMFLNLDSDRYPLKTYGDIGFRLYGPWMRHAINLLQSIQLLFNVGIIIIANGQGLSQVSKGKVCFIVLCIIWTVLGAILGQIRTLQKFGFVANAAIWMNVVVIILTMGVVAHSAPNYVAAVASNKVPGPPFDRVTTSAGAPPGMPFTSQVVGLMQAVYSYGGAMLFTEFMSEMRRPWDFWKGMVCAQTFIFYCYILFGLADRRHVIGLVSSLIAAALYGNIGIKVIYQNVIKEFFHAPELTEKKGKLIWIGMVPIYWAIAFVIAAAVPQFSNISALVGAACIMQFSYTFPPLLMLAFEIKQHAMLPNEGFDPATGRTTRLDGGFRRWRRGVMVNWPVKLWNLVYFLGAATTAVLGIYSAVVSIIAGFAATNAVSSFGCASPVGG